MEPWHYRLNMEGDRSPKLFGLHVTWCAQLLLICWDPPIPQHWDSYTRALLASKDRRHLFVTPWEIGREGDERRTWEESEDPLTFCRFRDSEGGRGFAYYWICNEKVLRTHQTEPSIWLQAEKFLMEKIIGKFNIPRVDKFLPVSYLGGHQNFLVCTENILIGEKVRKPCNIKHKKYIVANVNRYKF